MLLVHDCRAPFLRPGWFDTPAELRKQCAQSAGRLVGRSDRRRAKRVQSRRRRAPYTTVRVEVGSGVATGCRRWCHRGDGDRAAGFRACADDQTGDGDDDRGGHARSDECNGAPFSGAPTLSDQLLGVDCIVGACASRWRKASRSWSSSIVVSALRRDRGAGTCVAAAKPARFGSSPFRPSSPATPPSARR